MLAARSETVCTGAGMPARSLMLVSPVHVPVGQVLLLHAEAVAQRVGPVAVHGGAV
jgi:hypothetical protein